MTCVHASRDAGTPNAVAGVIAEGALDGGAPTPVPIAEGALDGGAPPVPIAEGALDGGAPMPVPIAEGALDGGAPMPVPIVCASRATGAIAGVAAHGWTLRMPGASAVAGTPGVAASPRTSGACSAARTARAVRNRASGDFASRTLTTRSSASDAFAHRDRSGGGATWRCMPIKPPVPPSKNGGRPVTIAKITQPNAYRSLRASRSRRPSHCSGDMYSGVPTSAPVAVRTVAWCASLAIPKSTTIARLRSREMMMFSGLRSRWITPASCAAASADAT